MIIQVVLSFGLLLLAVYAFSQRARSRLVAWGMLAVCGVGEGLVLAPDISNRLAHIVGIGRGADLVVYCFILASLGLILNLHLRLHAVHEDVTELARHIAVLTAERPAGDIPPSAGSPP